jgi:hypothetical protein
MYHVTPLDLQKFGNWEFGSLQDFIGALVLVVGPKLSFGLYEVGTHVVLKMVEGKYIYLIFPFQTQMEVCKQI